MASMLMEPRKAMDKKRLEKHRKRLEQEWQSIFQSIQRSRSAEADLEITNNIDEGDVAVNSYQKELSFTLQDSDAVRLKAIEVALNRFEKAHWGLCASCDEPIPEARLRAVPWATLCVCCFSRTETTEKNSV